MATRFLCFFKRFARDTKRYSLPICFCAAIVSRKLDETKYGDILPDSMVDDVINTVQETYNNPDVATQYAYIREQQSNNDDIMLQQYMQTLINENNKDKIEQLTLMDVGCGCGTTMAKIMRLISSEYDTIRSCKLIGIDIASNMLLLSNKNLETCIEEINEFNGHGENVKFDYELIEGDMRYLTQIIDMKCDGIICNYSIIHVPRQYHENILQQIHKLLKNNGLLCICMGVVDLSLYYASIIFEDKAMFWSHYDSQINLEIIKKCDFEIIDYQIINDGTSSESKNLFVIAKKKSQC